MKSSTYLLVALVGALLAHVSLFVRVGSLQRQVRSLADIAALHNQIQQTNDAAAAVHNQIQQANDTAFFNAVGEICLEMQRIKRSQNQSDSATAFMLDQLLPQLLLLREIIPPPGFVTPDGTQSAAFTNMNFRAFGASRASRTPR